MKRRPLCRVTAFGRDRAWDVWNPDDVTGSRPGFGNFYWRSPRDAYRRARVLLAQDPTVTQIKIETIGARFVGRLYRP